MSYRSVAKIEVERRLVDAIDSSGLPIGVLLRHPDSPDFCYQRPGPFNVRYISSSTAKPVMTAVILDQVAEGNLSLDDEWQQTGATVHHLLSMTSGATGHSAWKEPSWNAYLDAVHAYDFDAPLGAHRYGTGHLDCAGVMAVDAAGAYDWQDLFDQWRAKTGLFPGATWNGSYVIAPSREFNITAHEYADFLQSIAKEQILTPELCRAMYAEQCETTQASIWYGEDWGFGYGFWRECQRQDYLASQSLPRIVTTGVGGQMAYYDFPSQLTYVQTVPFDEDAGVAFRRRIEPLCMAWAYLSRRLL